MHPILEAFLPDLQHGPVIVFGHDFDGAAQSAICLNCGQPLKDADIHCKKLLLYSPEEETLP